MVSLDALPYLDVGDGQIGPELMTIQSERQKQVQLLLSTLSPTDRAAVVMRYWYDFSYDEISEVLSLSNSAVKSRLHRARRSLANAWKEETQNQRMERIPYGTETA